jgi:hypothetical protein
MKHAFRTAFVLVLSLATQTGWAYSCTGLVDYLGIGNEGVVGVSLRDATPVHKICSIGA